MTEQELNKAIAEKCGYSDLRGQGETLVAWKNPKSPYPVCIPSYTTDLNACHAAEATLGGGEQFGKYQLVLMEVLEAHAKRDGADYWIFHATAPQRANALARTWGIWKEEE